MNDQRIRLAVVGAGAIGRRHIELVTESPEAELMDLIVDRLVKPEA
jgi:dihydrodipicolinate reductase